MDVQDFIVNRDQHMRPLEYDLSENFNELVKYLNDMGVLNNVPVGVTSESEIVSISDAYPAPPRALNVYGKSTQTGTPTPDAPVPILSVDDLLLVLAGKNLLDRSTEEAGYINSVGGQSGGSGWLRSTYIPIAGGGTYTFTPNSNAGGSAYGCCYDANKSAIASSLFSSGPTTFTAPENARYVRVSYRDTSTNVQLEAGSTATDYMSYVTPITVPDLLPEGTDLRSLPDGTKDELNLAYLRPSTREGWAWYSRELVQRIHHEVITEFDQRSVANYAGEYRSTRGEKVIPSAVVNSETKGICSHAPWTNSSSSTATSVSRVCAYRSYGTSTILCVVLTTDNTDENFTTLENMNAWLATHGPIEVDCELATPVTTALDPIELPQLPSEHATVWCDGGSETPTLVLEYVRDTNAAIADLSEAIADIVSG